MTNDLGLKDFNPMGVELDNDEEFAIGTTIIDPPTAADYTEFEMKAIEYLKTSRPKQEAPVRPANKVHKPTANMILGEVTSDVSANVYCYHYAIFDGKLAYLNLAGPNSGIESIRAKLSKGEVCHLHNLDDINATPIPLSAGKYKDGAPMTGMFEADKRHHPTKRVVNAIITHEDMREFGRGFSGAFHLLRTSDEQAIYIIKDKIQAITGLAIYDQWLPYLWFAGRLSMNIRQPNQAGFEGDMGILSVERDANAWKRLIAGGLAEGIITLPEIN